MRAKKKTISYASKEKKASLFEHLKQRVIADDMPATQMAKEVRKIDRIKKSKDGFIKVRSSEGVERRLTMTGFTSTTKEMLINPRQMGAFLAMHWCLVQGKTQADSIRYVMELFAYAGPAYAKGGVWKMYEEHNATLDGMVFFDNSTDVDMSVWIKAGYSVTEISGRMAVKGVGWYWLVGQKKAVGSDNITFDTEPDKETRVRILSHAK